MNELVRTKQKSRDFTILIDFDGTCVTHEYPDIGLDIGAVKPLQYLTQNGYNLILFTMRDGKELEDAVGWFKKHNIPLYGIQTNPTQSLWTSSPKAYGNLIIDDNCLGIDLIYQAPHRPYVDWNKTSTKLFDRNLLNKEQLIDIHNFFKTFNLKL